MPEICDVCTFKEAVEKVEMFDVKLLADSENKPGMKSYDDKVVKEKKKLKGLIKRVAVAVGPEGGFTPDELEYAGKSKFIPINLGERRLRSETAGLVALTILLYNENDL